METIAARAQAVMISGGVIALFLSGFLSLILARSIVRPMQQASDSARVIAAGDLTETIQSAGSDEGH